MINGLSVKHALTKGISGNTLSSGSCIITDQTSRNLMPVMETESEIMLSQ